jgi:hypothetical protein
MEQQAQQETAQQIPPPSPQFTPEQMNQIKNALISQVGNSYVQFVNGLRGLPGHQSMKGKAFDWLDTGMLWLKESIVAMDASMVTAVAMPAQPVPSEPVNDQPVDPVPAADVDQPAA